MRRGGAEPGDEIEQSSNEGTAEEAPISATALVGSRVELGRVSLGLVRDVLFGADLGVVLGLAVETRAGRQCFLPWAGVKATRGRVVMSAPTLLLGEVELDYYTTSGIRLADVIDVDLGVEGREALVRDITLRPDGRTADLIVSHGNRRLRAVSVGDLRVHWSARQPPRLTVGSGRRRRSEPAGARMLAFAIRRPAA
jgi:hypothetical protein